MNKVSTEFLRSVNQSSWLLIGRSSWAEPSQLDDQSGATSSLRLKIPARRLTTVDQGLLVCLMRRRRDPIELEIFKNLYHSIAEEMGAALRRTAFSPNIKERRDYSCAVFDGGGQVIAMGDHLSGHLGSMPMSVRVAIDAGPMNPGDMVVLNDPLLLRRQSLRAFDRRHQRKEIPPCRF